MRGLLLAALLIAMPARAERAVEIGALAVAEASLAVDMLQTLSIRTAVDGSHEVNPLLGRHPSDGAVVGYFATAMLATAFAEYVLPQRFKVLAPIFVLALEVPQIGHNLSVGCGMRLPF